MNGRSESKKEYGRVILLRYGELYLKGRNRPFFENTLARNIRAAIGDIPCVFERTRGRYTVSDYAPGDEGALTARIADVIGLNSYSVALRVPAKTEDIFAACAAVAPPSGTFKLVCNRADKKFPLNSMDVVREAGAFVLERNPSLKVDLHNPGAEILIDIREDGAAFVCDNARPCPGGLPVGTGGRAVALLSGGIDSPVAAYMMARRGMKISALHFHSYPYTSAEAREKVVSLARTLARFCGDVTLRVARFTDIQEAIRARCAENYSVTVMRRAMLRIACAVAKKEKAQAIVTGESLGQVASQTVESITATNAVADIPVLRPLIGMDKEEIIGISRGIGAYGISILPYEDCCTVFLPRNPVITPSLAVAEREEEKLNLGEFTDGLEIETLAVKREYGAGKAP